MTVEFRFWRTVATQEALLEQQAVLGQISEGEKQLQVLHQQIEDEQNHLAQLQQRAAGLADLSRRFQEEPLADLRVEGNRASLADFVRVALSRHQRSIGLQERQVTEQSYGQFYSLQELAMKIGFSHLKKLSPDQTDHQTDIKTQRQVTELSEWLKPTGRKRGHDLEISLGSIGPFFATPREMSFLHLLLSCSQPVPTDALAASLQVDHLNVRKRVMRLRGKFDTKPPSILVYKPYEGYYLNLGKPEVNSVV